MKSYDRINKVINLFSKEEILKIGRIKKEAFTRNRKLPFDKFCMSILAKKGKTLTMELNEYFDDIKESEKCISKQNFSKQRCNINPEVFKILNEEYVKDIYSSNEYDTLKGYIVTAIDGSIIEIPNTKKLQEEYGYTTSGKNRDSRLSARAKVSGIFDVMNGVMIDSQIDKYDIPERDLAKKNIEKMINILGENKSIIIFDRGYFSIELMYYLEKRKIKYLFRLKKGVYEKEIAIMKEKDEVIEINTTGRKIDKVKDKEMRKELREKRNIKTRIVLYELNTGEEEILVTNLEKEKFDREEIGKLYFKRWEIEKSYDVMKNKLEIENFSGKKKIIIEQDFYSQMLVLNMLYDVRKEMNNQLLKEGKEKKRKYDYQVNTNILAGFMKNLLIQIFIEEDEKKKEKMHKEFIEKIKRYIHPIRPGRNNKRKIYVGRNKYQINKRRSN